MTAAAVSTILRRSAIAALLAAAILLGSPFITLGPWLDLVAYFHPGIDAPDHWALAVHYAVTASLAIGAIGAVCLAASCIRTR